MKKKKIFIILIIGVLVLIGMINFEKIEGFIYLNCISYDMEISYQEPQSTGGYSNTIKYYRINTKKKKEYIITDKYVFGVPDHWWEKGSYYSLEVKNLTDEQINKLKEYAYGSIYIKDSSATLFYVTIKYDGQIKTYKTRDFKY